MIDVDKSQYLKYLLFFSLYFIQGILLTLSWIILPIYFLDMGIPLSLASVAIAIAMIPWSLKFLFGGIVDYYIQKGRKIFIVLGGIIFAAALNSIAFLDPSNVLLLYIAILFIGVSGIIILDVAIDAWAIESSRKQERGKISGSMFSGQYIGRAFGSISLGFIAFSYGYNYVFHISGVFVIITILFTLFFKEKNISRRKEYRITKILIYEFKKRTTQIISFFALILQISYGIIVVTAPWFIEDKFDLDISNIGSILAILLVFSALGSMTGGMISDKIGRKKALYFFIFSCSIFIILLTTTKNIEQFILFYGLVSFFNGAYFVVAVALLMDITNKRIAATQFSFLASITNAGLIAGNSVSGILVSSLGFNRVFLLSAWFLGPVLVTLFLINIKK
jgi:MFS family permease